MRQILVVVLLLAGCEQGSDILSDSFGDQGDRTRVSAEHPEVGIAEAAGERCSAVLLTPYVILTGDGCVADPDDLGIFRPGAGSTASARTYRIDAVRSFGDEVDGIRLVLAHLAEAVPGTIARPARLSEREPALHETVSRYGYDCTRVEDALPIKRVQSYAWGQEIETCPSGVTFRSDGTVFQLEAGPIADVVAAFEALRDELFAWPAPLEAAGAEGLLASWSFDEGYESGVEGPAATFDGEAAITRPRPLLAHRTAFTWSAWIRPRAAGALYTEGEPEMTLGILLRDDGSIAYTAYHWASPEPWMTGASERPAVTWSAWNQVTVSLEDGGPGVGLVRFSVNGRPAGTAEVQASSSPWTSAATLGDGYTGDLDEVRLYDHAGAGQ